MDEDFKSIDFYMKEKKNNLANLDNQKLRNLFYMMKKIRLVEERIALEYPKNEIRCPTHLSIGQEGVPAALSLYDFRYFIF